MRPALLASLALLFLPMLGCGSTRNHTAAWPARQGEAPQDPWSAAAVGFAEAQIGKRYCWGGTGPSCFDCSGLVQAAWRYGGIKLPRTSDAQGRALEEVPVTQAKVGDILWWSGHVGLYEGNGWMIDAYHSGAGVVRRRAVVPERVLRVVPASAWPSRFAQAGGAPPTRAE